MLSLGAYLTGVVELAVIAAALAFGAIRLRRALVPGWAGAPARLVEAVLALSTLLVICEVLGLLRAFEELPLVVTCLVAGLGIGVLAGRRAGADGTARGSPVISGFAGAGVRTSAGGPIGARPLVRRRPFGGQRLQFGIAAVATAVVFAHWSVPTLEAFDRGIYGFDSQWYHLPFAARFAETGSIWDFHYTTPVLLSWFYPANSELFHAVGMVAFERDLLSPLINLGWLALALLAAWCLGRPWGVGGLAVLGAFVVLDAGLLADQAGEARNDVIGVATILAAAALLVQRPIPLLASGLAAGLALGTRFTSLAPVAALTAGAIWLAGSKRTAASDDRDRPGHDAGPAAASGRRTRPGGRVRAAAVWAVALFATGGLWYLRNLVATGNPLPQVTSLGPLSLPGPDQALGGRPSFSVAHYATDFGVWADWFAPALREGLGLLWPLVLALAAVGAVVALARGPSRPVRVLGAVAIVTALAYLVTPVTASGPEGQPLGFGPNLRYLAPGLALALALFPVALTGLGQRLRIAGAMALTAAAGAVAAEPERWEGGHLIAAAVAGLLVALALGGAALAIRSRPRARGADADPSTSPGPAPSGVEDHAEGGISPAGGPVVTVGLVVIALIVVAVGYFEQRRYLEDRYADPAAVLPNPGLDSVFVWARNVEDARIATTTTRQYPLYGTDLSNHVQFVGVERPEGGFTAPASCEEWRQAVDEGDYDYVVTALDRIEEGQPRRSPERIWTQSSPSATEIVRDGPAAVYELDGPLDPAACRQDAEADHEREAAAMPTSPRSTRPRAKERH